MDTLPTLPPRDTMWRAIATRDPASEGVFVVAVTTTGVFCRPTCPAPNPRPDHVEFLPTVRDALAAGFRPCRRCKPLEPLGGPPAWLRPLVEAVEVEPTRRWRDRDIRAAGLDPARVRRWFSREHGLTFQAYSRARRIGVALGALREGRPILDAGLDHGWESASGFRDAFTKLVGAPPGRGRARRPLLVARFLTPLGPMVGAALDDRIALLEFADRRMLPTEFRQVVRRFDAAPVPGSHASLAVLEAQLVEYFAGRRSDIDLPLAIGGTPFQEAAWAFLRTIPAGETRTYAEGAAAVGRPGAARAFGHAIGANRLAILVPCHRVVGADGRLTGYGGGVWRKRALLDIETRGRDGASRATSADAT